MALGVSLCLIVEAPEALASRGEWRAVSRQLAAPWPKIQRRNGSLPDALRERRWARYGNGMAGLGLLQTGIRERKRRLVRAGVRAVSAETRRVFDSLAIQEFRIWAVAEAYSLVGRRLGHWGSARAARRRWASWLRHQRIWWLRQPLYENKVLVEAVAVLELLRTGLRSRVPRAVLGSGRSEARRRAVRLINRRIPAVASRPGFVLSDPGPSPTAYHALSYAMYARAVRLLGRRASRRSRALLRRLGRTTSHMVAPTGDLAYWGRSQAEKWTLSAAAYGLAATAREPGSRRASDRRYHALADRLLRRLRAYGAGPRGEWIVPSIRQNRALGRRSLDRYSHAPEYTGLALVYLNWAIPLLPRRSAVGRIAADRPMRAVIGHGRARFAVVRQRNLWFAVRERGTGGFRYDFGPIAAKRLESGVWRDIVPLRPAAHGSTGPVLRSGRRRGTPLGTSMRVTRTGRVLIRGGFRWRNRWLRRRVRFVVEPTDCLSLLVSARAGDRYDFSAFLPSGRPHEVGPFYGRVGDRGAVFSEPLTSARLRRGYASASHARLTRGRFSIRARSSRFVGMGIC